MSCYCGWEGYHTDEKRDVKVKGKGEVKGKKG
jgi:hypothetical protein